MWVRTRRESENEAEGRQRRRRRRRRGRGGDREGSGIAANAPQPPDDALEAMAKIGGLHPSAALESDAEAGEIALAGDLAGDDEPMASHQDIGRRSRRDGRRTRKTPGPSDTGPSDATHLEFALISEAEPEPAPSDVTGGIEADEGPSPAGRARRGRRAPREPRTRSARAGEVASTPNSTSAFIADDVQDRHQTPDIAPQSNDENEGKVTASPGRVKVDARETPQSAPSDDYGAPGRDDIPSPLTDESSQPNALDPARPKRSGWWQRAKVSWRG